MEPTNLTPARNPQLWQQAKSRARFKSHLFTYLAVNALLWTIWALTDHGHHEVLPWPAWATIFWGIGLVFRGIRTYGGWNRQGLAERDIPTLSAATVERFVKATGLSFAQWRQQARLLEALERLASGERVLDIALALGYSSPTAFATMFKRQFGLTPSAFFDA